MTRVAVVGATGRLGTPICAGIEAAEDLTLVARVARSLGAGGYGEYASLEAALATCQVDVVLEVTGPESVEENVRLALERGIAVVAGATGLADDAVGGARRPRRRARHAAASRSPTSRSARC